MFGREDLYLQSEDILASPHSGMACLRVMTWLRVGIMRLGVMAMVSLRG